MRLKSEEFVSGQYYHIYNHAASNGMLFYNEDDYLKCLRLMQRYLDQSAYSILAYCLMPNHYHILLYQKDDKPIFDFFSKLWYSYSCYINKKYKIRGTIFSGKQQHIGIRDEKYLKSLCAYIHLNPVKAGLVDTPEEWKWSNYQDWIGMREGSLIDREIVKSFFSTPDEYRDCIDSLVDISDKRVLIDAENDL